MANNTGGRRHIRFAVTMVLALAGITLHPSMTIVAADILIAILINVVTQMDYNVSRDGDGLGYAGQRNVHIAQAEPDRGMGMDPPPAGRGVSISRW